MKNAKVQEVRRYDHVYDPVLSYSSTTDHARATKAASVKTLQRVPDHNNYFSQNSWHYPDHKMRTSAKLDVPKHVDLAYNPQAAAKPSHSAQVSGKNRNKFFRRPVVPFLQRVPPEVMLAKANLNPENNNAGPPSETRPTYSRVREIGTQSMYRESEAQTDPFTPDYTVQPGSHPEVLKIAHMSHSNGDFPAGMRQVELVERMRFKEMIEKSLPPISDESSFELRRRLMERLEIFQFKNKEFDMDVLQNERLKYVKETLWNREAQAEYNSEQRVEQLRRNQLVEKDMAVAAIQHNRIKTLRKLARARNNAEPLRPRGRDIVKEYSNFSSCVYAPVLREGKFPTKSQQPLDGIGLQLPGLGEAAIDLIEQSIPSKLIQPRIARPKLNKSKRGSARRHNKNIRKHLEAMDVILREQRRKSELEKAGTTANKTNPATTSDEKAAVPETKSPTAGDEDKAPTRAWSEKASKEERPVTPQVEPSTRDDELHNALVLIQRLLKGRAVQNAMYFGKEKRLELIKEIQETPNVDQEDGLLAREHQREERYARKQERLRRQACVQGIVSVVASRSLLFLSQEMERQEEDSVMRSALLNLAEERRVREAEEMGRRQAEEQMRAKAEKAANAIADVYNSAADSFVDSIMQISIDTSAHIKFGQRYGAAYEAAQEAEAAEALANSGQGGTSKTLVGATTETETKEDEPEFFESTQAVLKAAIGEVENELGEKSTNENETKN